MSRTGLITGIAIACLGSMAVGAADEPTQEPLLRIEPGTHIATINAIGADGACTRLVTGSSDKTIRVWDISDWRHGFPEDQKRNQPKSPELLQTIRPPIGTGNNGKIFALAVSMDGRWIAAGGWDPHDTVFVFDGATGRMQRRITGLRDVIRHLTFSPDDRYLAATLAGGQGHRVWRTDDWSEVGGDKSYRKRDSYGAAFDTKSRLWTIAYDGTLRRYEEGYSAPAKMIDLPGDQPFRVAVRPQGDLVAVAYSNSTDVHVYDAESLELRFTPDTSTADNGDLANLTWSSDGKRLYAGGRFDDAGGVNQILVWDAAGKGPIAAFAGSLDTIRHLRPCGEAIAMAAADPALALIDGGGARLYWQGHVMPDLRPFGTQYLNTLMVSPTGDKVRFQLFDIRKDAILFDIESARLTDAVDKTGGLHKADTASFPIEDWFNTYGTRFDGKALGLREFERSRSLSVAPDLQRFVLGTEWRLRAYDKTGKLLWWKHAPSVVWGVNITRDGRMVVASYGDGTIRWHRLSDGQELLALFVHAHDRRWVAWTPKGYYMASPGAETLIGWHVNQGWDKEASFFPVSLFRRLYYRPDIVRLVLSILDEDGAIAEANRRTQQPEAPENVREVLPPVVKIISPDTGSSFSTRTVRIAYTATTQSGSRITDLEIRIDGRPIATRGAVPLRPEEDENTIRIDVPVPPRDVTVSLIAWAQDGAHKRASEEAFVRLVWAGQTTETSKKPRLFALLVGVSDYEQPGLDLAWAAQDARDVERALQFQQGAAYSKVETRLLLDGEATRRGIEEGLEWLEKNTAAEDYAVIFLAGHGVTDKKQRFFFLPSAANPKRLLSTAISRDTLVGVVESLAGKVMMFIDACHAADGLEAAGWGRAPADLNGLVNDLASAEIGAVMFASSTGREVSIERDEWRNGAFTEALQDGLGGEADFTRDGLISTEELGLYLTARVEVLSEGAQRPVMHKSRAIPAFVIAATR